MSDHEKVNKISYSKVRARYYMPWSHQGVFDIVFQTNSLQAEIERVAFDPALI